MGNITLETIKDGNIEECRTLCNELMAFQKSKATIHPEMFDYMNFDTRMKKSYDGALETQVVVVKDDSVPVGYIFSTIDEVGPEAKEVFPDWAPKTETTTGFYPDWLELPKKIGCLSNLYLRDEYRGMHLGSQLFNIAMDWLESFEDVDLTFVYISNGNDTAMKFYLDNGFNYSHEVYNGFIKAAYKEKKNK